MVVGTRVASPRLQEQGGSKGSSKWDRLAWVESQLQYLLGGKWSNPSECQSPPLLGEKESAS